MNRFAEQFRPSFIASDIDALTPDLFVPGGPLQYVDKVAFDVDGTIVAHHETTISEKSKRTLGKLAEIGLGLDIISNAYGERVDELEEMFGLHTFGMRILTPRDVAGDDNPKRHRKPSPEMLQLSMADVDGDVLMVGDQLLKDIWSANRAGMPSLLVPRRGSGDDWKVRTLQRPLEMGIRLSLGLPQRASDYPPELRETNGSLY